MSRLRALSFDLDYTLWSLDQVIERAESRVHDFLLQHYPVVGGRYSPELVLRERQRVLEAAPDIAHDLGEIRLRTFRRITDAAGAPAIAARQAMRIFMAGRNDVQLYDETQPLLDALHGRYTLIALTNGNADVHRIGIGHYFAASILASDVGAAKPAAPMFQAAIRTANVAAAEMLHIGDDPETDVFGAAQAGIGAVWLNREGMPWPDRLPRVPYVEIRTLSQLPEIIQSPAGAFGRSAS